MNKIISISGEPASGKSTTIKEIKRELEEKGYKVKILSVGQIFRNLAAEKGLSLEEFSKQVQKKRKDVDLMLDENTKKYGEKFIQESSDDEILIVDARLGWYVLPESFSVRLTTNDAIAGKRVFNDSSREAGDQYSSLEEATNVTAARKRGEVARYKQRYGIDLEDENNYKLLIDTSYSTIKDSAKVIAECFEDDRDGYTYSKKWTSPKTLLPLQNVRDTAVDFDEIVDSIRNNGYLPSEAIDVVVVDGVRGIINGHHRNFAAANLGISLVPYNVIAKDDETMKKYTRKDTARSRFSAINKSMLYDYEEIFKIHNRDFSYADIYPEIYKAGFIEKLKTANKEADSDIER